LNHINYSVLTFGSYEIYKQALLNKFPNTKPAFIYAISAILGDVTGSGWLCPSEVMKQQLQAGIYPSMSEAIKGIWSKSGIGGFYQGFTGGLSRDVPFRVAQLTTFEVTKSLYLNAKKRRSGGGGGDESLSAVEAAICGAAAGSFSAAITNPLDRIKTLMMTDVSNAYGGSVVACASKIVKDEGIRGLFAGVVPRVGYIAPSVCIFFVTYEFAQQKMQKREP
jgi:solute carrier family 25 S-adenosylmethionine transporter 26